MPLFVALGEKRNSGFIVVDVAVGEGGGVATGSNSSCRISRSLEEDGEGSSSYA